MPPHELALREKNSKKEADIHHQSPAGFIA
jgi:hypothetical protein